MLKMGDKVVCTDNTNCSYKLTKGKIYTVKESSKEKRNEQARKKTE